MGINTLRPVSDGSIAKVEDINQFLAALRGDFVPRDENNVPTDLAGNLGTASLKWNTLYVNNIIGASLMNLSTGSGVPNNNTASKVGMAYLDTTNNRVYMAVSYTHLTLPTIYSV